MENNGIVKRLYILYFADVYLPDVLVFVFGPPPDDRYSALYGIQSAIDIFPNINEIYNGMEYEVNMTRHYI